MIQLKEKKIFAIELGAQLAKTKTFPQTLEACTNLILPAANQIIKQLSISTTKDEQILKRLIGALTCLFEVFPSDLGTPVMEMLLKIKEMITSPQLNAYLMQQASKIANTLK